MGGGGEWGTLTAPFLCTAPPPGTSSQGTELLPSIEFIVNTGHF